MASSTANAYPSENCRWRYLGHGLLVSRGRSNATMRLPVLTPSNTVLESLAAFVSAVFTLSSKAPISPVRATLPLHRDFQFPNLLSRDDYRRAHVVRYRAQPRNLWRQCHGHQTVRSQILPQPIGPVIWRWILLLSIAISQARTSPRVDPS